jgi:hypothetical protein
MTFVSDMATYQVPLLAENKSFRVFLQEVVICLSSLFRKDWQKIINSVNIAASVRTTGISW